MKKNLPYLSVCIPSYKRLSISQTISSIVSQPQWEKIVKEILIINDCPEDILVQELVVQFACKYAQINYHKNNVNLGLDANFIKLMQTARGTHILFLTDDDTLCHNSLSIFDRLIRAYPSTGLITGARLIIVNGIQNRLEIVCKEGIYNKSNTKVLGKILLESNVLSGLCLRRDIIKFGGIEAYYGTLFAHLLIVARNILHSGVFYTSSPIVNHTVGNKVFWNYKPGYNLKDMLEIGFRISQESQALGKVYRNLVLRALVYISYLNLAHPTNFFTTVREILTTNITVYELITQYIFGIFTTINHKIYYKRYLIDYLRN